MVKPLDLKNDRMEKRLEEKWLDMCVQAQYCKGVSETGNHKVPDWYNHDKFGEIKIFLMKDIMG